MYKKVPRKIFYCIIRKLLININIFMTEEYTGLVPRSELNKEEVTEGVPTEGVPTEVQTEETPVDTTTGASSVVEDPAEAISCDSCQ